MTASLLYTGEKLAVLSASGPASDVTVATGTAGDIDLAISLGEVKQILEHLGVVSISGLPDGLAIAGITFPDATTLRIRVFNPTAGDITVPAGSVSASVLVKAV